MVSMNKKAILDGLMGEPAKPELPWVAKGEGLKTLGKGDVTYVQQKDKPKPGTAPDEGQMNPLLRYMMMMHAMGPTAGGSSGPTITLGGGAQGGNMLEKMLMMHMMEKQFSKKGSADPSKVLGGSPERYAKSILQQLTPDHYAAAGGSGGQDTIEELVERVIPQQIMAQHAMHLGGGDVDLGRQIMDAHFTRHPARTGENLPLILEKLLKSHIAGSQHDAAAQALKGLGGDLSDLGGARQQPFTREEMLKIINKHSKPGGGREPRPAATQTEAVDDYFKVGMLKSALIGRLLQHFRDAPDPSALRHQPLKRFADPSGHQVQFDPESFHDVFMQDSSTKRLGRTLGEPTTKMLGHALTPGILAGMRRWSARGLGKGQQIDAAHQALANIAEATGFSGDPMDRKRLQQHFREMTGLRPGGTGKPGTIANYLQTQLSGAGAPRPVHSLSGLFGSRGVGGMDFGDPLANMVQQMIMMRAMAGGQGDQAGGMNPAILAALMGPQGRQGA